MIAHESLVESRTYAEERLKKYDLKSIVKQLFQFCNRSPESDIFGCYYIGRHTIDIYIIPCIIFSMLIEEDFLDMAIGTLAHELAHGFQHVGADKDNKIWDTFGKAELTLVEGLAEFYTREFCSTLSNSHPSIIRAFDKTSMYLPEQYRKYQEWGTEYGLETVYQEFIETRRNDICSFDEFHQGLKVTHKRLG